MRSVRCRTNRQLQPAAVVTHESESLLNSRSSPARRKADRLLQACESCYCRDGNARGEGLSAVLFIHIGPQGAPQRGGGAFIDPSRAGGPWWALGTRTRRWDPWLLGEDAAFVRRNTEINNGESVISQLHDSTRLKIRQGKVRSTKYSYALYHLQMQDQARHGSSAVFHDSRIVSW